MARPSFIALPALVVAASAGKEKAAASDEKILALTDDTLEAALAEHP